MLTSLTCHKRDRSRGLTFSSPGGQAARSADAGEAGDQGHGGPSSDVSTLGPATFIRGQYKSSNIIHDLQVIPSNQLTKFIEVTFK